MSGFLTDERGSRSSARLYLALALLFTGVVIALDSAFPWWSSLAAVYALLGTICTGLLAWAAGPRIAQYIGPQVGAVASGIAAAARRKSGTDDRFTDDER